MYSTNEPSAAVDTTPLLGDQISRARPPRFFRRPPSIRGAAQFLRRASSRSRPMREPSVRVREAATEEIEERQSDWAYSKPVVILDVVWNIAFVIVSISLLIMSRNETPSTPLRLWIVGYALQCVLHVLCASTEYIKRYSQPRFESGVRGQFWYTRNHSNSSSGSDDIESGNPFSNHQQGDDETSVAKHLESANTMFSFIWWIIGFYWVSADGQSLTDESPQLYWLCITFLAFDVFFVVICVAVACVIGLAVCCCLPCIIGILYAVSYQEGASKEDIEKLPSYRFRKTGNPEKHNSEIQESYGGIMTECDTDLPIDHAVPLEDAECCICLCAYDDGIELRKLPCSHHFHSACVDKWLYINPTCPLCKFDILKNSSRSGSEDA